MQRKWTVLAAFLGCFSGALLTGCAGGRDTAVLPDGVVSSYYEGQTSRAYKMLQKSIFKHMLEGEGFTDGTVKNPKWDYASFTEYAITEENRRTDAESRAQSVPDRDHAQESR